MTAARAGFDASGGRGRGDAVLGLFDTRYPDFGVEHLYEPPADR
jgi:hypothetical protein